FALGPLDSWGAATRGRAAGVATGAAAVGAGTALIVAFGGVAFDTVATGVGTTGAVATRVGATGVVAVCAVSSGLAGFGVSTTAVTAGGADLGVVFAIAGRAAGSTSRLTAGAGATARGGSGSRRRPAHVPTPRAKRQSAPNATRTGRERSSVRRRSCPISRTARARHARRSPAAASRKAFAKSVAVAYLDSGSLTSARRRTRSRVAGGSALSWRTGGGGGVPR